MAKYFKIQSLILCLCMIMSAFSGFSAMAAYGEIVSWDADLDFITLDFDQATELTADDIFLTADGEVVYDFTFAKNDFATAVQTASDRYTYLLTPAGGLEEDVVYTLEIDALGFAKTFAVSEITGESGWQTITAASYSSKNKFTKNGDGLIIEDYVKGSSNMQYWALAGTLVGNDTTADHYLPKTSAIKGSENWTEKDYTVKLTYKETNIARTAILFGIARSLEQVSGDTSTTTSVTALRTYDYANMTAAHDAGLYLNNGLSNRTSNPDRVAILERTAIPDVAYESGVEFKFSSRDDVVRVFIDGKKAFGVATEVEAGHPFFAVHGSSLVDANATASVELYDMQVTQCKEICATELDKTEEVEVKDTLEVTFAEAIDPATIENLKVVNEEGEEVNSERYEVSLSDDGLTATITFVKRLDYETNYTIDFSEVAVDGKEGMSILSVSFTTKELPPQSEELLASWDADLAGAYVTFSEAIDSFEATLTKDGVDLDTVAELVEGNTYSVKLADGSALEEGAEYTFTLVDIINDDSTKSLLFWSKDFEVLVTDGEEVCYEICDATLEEKEKIDVVDTLDVTFEKEIEPATIEGIKLFVTDGEEVDAENYEVTLSDDNLVATIAFENLEYETAYEIKIEGVELLGGKVIAIPAFAFTTKPQPKEIEDLLIDWNADLDFITLEFSEEIEELQASLLQGNEEIPVTFASAARSDMNESVSSRYTYKIVPEGGLKKDLGYRLTIGGIVSATEVRSDAEWIKSFKVSVLDEGFVNPSTSNAENDTYVYSTNGTVTQAADGKGIVIQYEGDKRVRTMIAHGVGKDSDATKSVGTRNAGPNGVYSQKDYTLKATFKNISGTTGPVIGIAHTYSPVNSYTYDHSWFRGIGVTVTVSSNSSVKAYSQKGATNMGTDGGGSTIWQDNKYTRSTTASGLDAQNGIELKLAMKGDTANIYINGGKTLDISSYNEVGAAALFFNPNVATAMDSYAEIADIVITRAYEITESEIDQVEDLGRTDSVTVTLDEAISESEAQNIKLVAEDGTVVEDAEITLSADGKTVTVSFSELAFKSVYTVNFDDVTLESGNELANHAFMTLYPKTELVSFGVADGGELEGTATVEAVLANNTDAMDFAFTATVAIYNSRGQMVAVDGGAYVLATGDTCTVKIENFECDPAEEYTAKCFIWDSFETMTIKTMELKSAEIIGE